MVKIEVPALLHKDLDGKSEIRLEAKSIDEAVVQIIKIYPQLEKALLSNDKKLKSYVRFCLNEQLLDPEKYNEPLLKDEDSLFLIIPISGG